MLFFPLFLHGTSMKLFPLFFVILSQLKGEITYEAKDPAYCYTIMEVPGDFCSLSAHLTQWLSEVETSKVSNCTVNRFKTISQIHNVQTSYAVALDVVLPFLSSS